MYLELPFGMSNASIYTQITLTIAVHNATKKILFPSVNSGLGSRPPPPRISITSRHEHENARLLGFDCGGTCGGGGGGGGGGWRR
jgi:hypothetical protein